MEKYQPLEFGKNVLLYISAIGLQKIFVTAYFWYYSTRISVADLGTYVFVLSFTSLFAIFIDVGLLQVLTRESAKDETVGELYLKNILGFKCCSAFLAIGVILFIHHLSPKAPFSLLVVAVCIMILDSLKQTLYSFVRGKRNFFFESVSVCFYQLITIAIGVVALHFSKNVIYLLFALLTASIMDVVYIIVVLAVKFKISSKPALNFSVLKKILSMAPAFTFAGIFNKGYESTDLIMIRYLASETALGYFAVPGKIISSLQNLVPTALGSVLFPTMSSYYTHSPQRLSQLLHKSFFYLLFISLPLSIGIFAFAQVFIETLWGNKFQPSVLLLQILAFSIPFTFCSFPFGAYLNASGNERYATSNRGIILLLNILIDITVIPFFGIGGVAVGWLCTTIILFCLDLFFTARCIKLRWHSMAISLLHVLGIALFMGGVGVLLQPYASIWILVPLLIALYIGSAFLFRIVSMKDFRALAQL